MQMIEWCHSHLMISCFNKTHNSGVTLPTLPRKRSLWMNFIIWFLMLCCVTLGWHLYLWWSFRRCHTEWTLAFFRRQFELVVDRCSLWQWERNAIGCRWPLRTQHRQLHVCYIWSQSRLRISEHCPAIWFWYVDSFIVMIIHAFVCLYFVPQCFDAVGWASGL